MQEKAKKIELIIIVTLILLICLLIPLMNIIEKNRIEDDLKTTYHENAVTIDYE